MVHVYVCFTHHCLFYWFCGVEKNAVCLNMLVSIKKVCKSVAVVLIIVVFSLIFVFIILSRKPTYMFMNIHKNFIFLPKFSHHYAVKI